MKVRYQQFTLKNKVIPSIKNSISSLSNALSNISAIEGCSNISGQIEQCINLTNNYLELTEKAMNSFKKFVEENSLEIEKIPPITMEERIKVVK